MTQPRRACTLEFGPAGKAGRSVSGLRTVFQVEHTRASTPSKATIEVFNLNPDSVGLLHDPDATLRLLAGYDGNPLQVFTGEPIKVETRRQGPDRVTRIEAEDGGKTWRTARVEVVSSTAITLQTVLDRALGAAGLAASIGAGVDLGAELTQGITYAGPLRDLLDTLTDSAGADWSLRDGVIVLSPRGGAATRSSVLLSPSTGMINTPARTDDGVEVTALIAPQLRPRDLFTVESEIVRGTYVADQVVFAGDTHATPWYVTVTGKPYT